MQWATVISLSVAPTQFKNVLESRTRNCVRVGTGNLNPKFCCTSFFLNNSHRLSEELVCVCVPLVIRTFVENIALKCLSVNAAVCAKILCVCLFLNDAF